MTLFHELATGKFPVQDRNGNIRTEIEEDEYGNLTEADKKIMRSVATVRIAKIHKWFAVLLAVGARRIESLKEQIKGLQGKMNKFIGPEARLIDESVRGRQRPTVVTQQRSNLPSPAVVTQQRSNLPSPAVVTQQRSNLPSPTVVTQQRNNLPSTVVTQQRSNLPPTVVTQQTSNQREPRMQHADGELVPEDPGQQQSTSSLQATVVTQNLWSKKNGHLPPKTDTLVQLHLQLVQKIDSND